ncbi:MAG: hypothetical protein HN888_02395 [Desulfobacula sp.]|jgi:hypothetical protein|nr:hypothetical protein [Desulfobacula sp.]
MITLKNIIEKLRNNKSSGQVDRGRYGIEEFFSLGSEIKLYEKKQNQKNQNLIQLDARIGISAK